MSVVPPSFLFSLSIHVQYKAGIPSSAKTKPLLGLESVHRLPNIANLDGKQTFADISLAWNDKGIGIVAEVTGKKKSLHCDLKKIDASDGLHVWFDTRNVQNVHRATRYCHRFSFLPTGKTGKEKATGQQLRIDRSRDEVGLADSKTIQVRSKIKKDSYTLEAWLPAEILTGFDPEQSPQLSFFYHLHDGELGDQFLTVDQEFPFAHDPSVWSTIELVGR